MNTKRLLALLLALAMVFSLCACGESYDDYAGSDDLVSKARMVEQLSNAGVKIAPDWIEKTFNVRLDKTINQEKRG